MAEDKLEYGENAARSRAKLTEKGQELFDFSSLRLRAGGNEAVQFGSLLQNFACEFPHATYWQLVDAVKSFWESPGFEKTMEEAQKVANRSLARKPS